MVRLCEDFDVHSVPGTGTVIAARYSVPPSARDSLDRRKLAFRLGLAAICLPMAGESECGDAWAVEETASGVQSVLVADGLGHGPKAAEAANAAVATFRRNPMFGPSEHLDAIHPALRATRGASVAIAAVDSHRELIRFAGVGNIAGTVFGGDGVRRGLVSHNGTVGLNMHKNQEFTVPWAVGSLLVMHSDGLATSWRFDNQPALRARAPGVIAGTLYRDFGRGRDDVTVVVARDGGPGG